MRLLLGITGVGLTVVVAATALVLDLPGRLLPADAAASPWRATTQALTWPLTWTLLLLPLDLLGGRVAVRQLPGAAAWFTGWLRGVALQLVVLWGAGVLLMPAARAGGLPGVVAAAVGTAAALAALLPTLVRLGVRTTTEPAHGSALEDAGLPPGAASWVECGDEAFVGGFGGLGRPRLLLPAAWRDLPPPERRALLVRRGLAGGAPRLGGLAVALGWIGTGAAVAALLGDLPTSAAGLVRFSLAATLWAFLGVLVLPTPSRRAVHALDRAAARAVGREAMAAAITALDRRQDDEPSRHPVVEAIFHPVPARDARCAGLDLPPPRFASGWRAARLALPLALGSWSLLGRSVHCNLGRPALWWMLPGD